MEKIKADMSMMDIMVVMSEGNPGALTILMQMISNPGGFLNVLTCDSLEIRGSKLYMLWNDCCRRNYAKFERTLTMLRTGVFSQEEIEKNLGLVRAIPFINDSLVVEGVPAYEGEEFLPSNPLWEKYCTLNREDFLSRLTEVLGSQK